MHITLAHFINVLLYTVKFVDKYRCASLCSSFSGSSLGPSLLSQKSLSFWPSFSWSPFNTICRLPNTNYIPCPALGSLEWIPFWQYSAWQWDCRAFAIDMGQSRMLSKCTAEWDHSTPTVRKTWIRSHILIRQCWFSFFFAMIHTNEANPTQINCSFCM